VDRGFVVAVGQRIVLVTFMDFSFLTGCAGQFWRITSGVCRVVAACVARGGRPAVLPPALLTEVHRRVMRAQLRILMLMERVRSGRQRGGWNLVAPAPVAGGLRRAAARPAMVLPRRFGWLVDLVGHEAAGCGSQLAHLLTDPEMVALVADVPQARRILAPLCRMLGVDCAGLRAVPRVRARKVAVLKQPTGFGGRVSEALAPERVGYVPSARWPKGVISRGVVRVKRG
jgi:hypothetical protein